MTKKYVIIFFAYTILTLVYIEQGLANEVTGQEEYEDSIDLTLINDTKYDLSKPFFGYKPTLGRGLRDQLNSSGGSACTSCAH